MNAMTPRSRAYTKRAWSTSAKCSRGRDPGLTWEEFFDLVVAIAAIHTLYQAGGWYRHQLS